MKTHKKELVNLFLFIISLIISINTTLQFFIIKDSNKYIDYKIEGTVKSNEKIIINKINIDGTNFDLNNYSNENSEYDNYNYSMKYLSDFTIKNTISKNSDIEILIDAENSDGKIKIYKDNQIDASYDLKEMNGTINYTNSSSLRNLIKDLIKSNMIIFIIIVLFLTFSYYFVIKKYTIKLINKIKQDNFKITDLIFFTIITFIILYSNIFLAFSVLKRLILIPIILYLIISNYIIKDKIRENVKYIFVSTIIPIGIIVGLLVAPFSVPDEFSHFYKSYMVSVNKKGIYKETDGSYKMTPPKELQRFGEMFRQEISSSEFVLKPKVFFNNRFKINYTKLTEDGYYVDNVIHLYKLAYIPSSLVIKIGCKFNLSVFLIFYLSRFINYLIWCIIMYISISVIPRFKKILLIICSFPIMVQQSMAINQDYLTNALFILLCSLIIKEIFSKAKINIKSIITIMIVGALLCFCKMGYFSAMFLILLIPKKRFRNNKEKYFIRLTPIILVLGLFCYTMLDSYSINPTLTNSYSVSYILKNPLIALHLYKQTLLEKIDYQMFRGLLDNFYYSTKVHYGMYGMIIQIIYVIMILISKMKEQDFNIKQKFYILILCGMQIGIIYTAMLGCSIIGNNTISGLQARYFFPPLLLLLFGTLTNKFTYESKNVNNLYSILIGIVYIIVLNTIIVKCYI